MAIAEQPIVASMRHLERLLGAVDRCELKRLAVSPRDYYRPYHEPRPGKSPRHIDRPIGDLKKLQELIRTRVLALWQAPSGMYGSVKGRSPRDNAVAHLGASLSVSVDIKNCYPSISRAHVAQALKRELRCPPPVATLLCEVLTVNDHLPQGAPSSPTIANMVLAQPYREIRDGCAALGIGVTTSFVDDFTFSGPRAREAIRIARGVLGRMGLRLARKKTEVMNAHKSHKITGYEARRAGPDVTIPKKKRQEIRLGILSVAAGTRDARERVEAQIRWAEQQVPTQGAALRRYAERRLQGRSGELTEGAARKERVPCDCSLGEGMLGHLAAGVGTAA